MRNRTNLLLFSTLSIFFSSPLMATPCPELDIHNDVKWRPHWPSAHVEAPRKIGNYHYTWKSGDFALHKYAIKRIRQITQNTDPSLSCEYDVVLTDGAHEETETVAVYLDEVHDFEPTHTLIPHEAERLINEFTSGRDATVTEGSYTWKLKKLSRVPVNFRVAEVEFEKNSPLTRDGKGGAKVYTFFEFRSSPDLPNYLTLEATFESYLIP
ncbi:MAG: hypothetical protein BGO67_01410 [Alphaproteobacteria bacterium 41-28]|nr:MAG: hypothetical protein BGO67_01410 [Alphaproteobacteria bacterium 41-28]